ncbi:hypothetical protein OOJ96_00290 [Pseudomonas sp. 15FMM2]|uniref:Uncharacterized protein n=1 Tax=Pseudomonas imrae TaxID=2992837 RepID=A0ACC7P8C7_9PSED
MPSNELDTALEQWWSCDQASLQLSENNDAITLRRIPEGMWLSAQLSTDKADHLLQEKYLMLGRSSLEHFHGALAQDPDNGLLWILLVLEKIPDLHTLRASLTDLLNQRDTLRALAGRVSPGAARSSYPPINSLS